MSVCLASGKIKRFFLLPFSSFLFYLSPKESNHNFCPVRFVNFSSKAQFWPFRYSRCPEWCWRCFCKSCLKYSIELCLCVCVCVCRLHSNIAGVSPTRSKSGNEKKNKRNERTNEIYFKRKWELALGRQWARARMAEFQKYRFYTYYVLDARTFYSHSHFGV